MYIDCVAMQWKSLNGAEPENLTNELMIITDIDPIVCCMHKQWICLLSGPLFRTLTCRGTWGFINKHSYLFLLRNIKSSFRWSVRRYWNVLSFVFWLSTNIMWTTKGLSGIWVASWYDFVFRESLINWI